MFGLLKDKLKKAFNKFRGVEETLEKNKEGTKEKIKEELKEVADIKKEEKVLGKKEEKLEKNEEVLKEKEKEVKEEIKEEPKKEVKEELKEEIKEIKEKVKETKQEIIEVKKEVKQEEKKELSFLGKIKQKLTTSRLTEESFEELFQPIELTLIENNFSIKIIEKLKEKLSKELIDKPFKRSEAEEKTKEVLKDIISGSMKEPFDLVELIKENKDKPYVIVFFGINGAGKTTTIAKLTSRLLKNQISCVLAAADTFRAASIEQLEKHASNLKVRVIKHDYGADPAAVAFDAVKHARSQNIQAVLIDTAGRMHTKSDLMKEMEKICRVAKPHKKIFVAEAITGSDLVEQLQKFNDAVGIDAVILTKADVDEKGGAMISVGEVTGKPILYLGTGQKYEDLERFDKEKILDSIF